MKNNNTLGKPSLAKYIISVRTNECLYSWPQKDRAAIKRAHRLHDSGEATLCQKTLKEDKVTILYLIPHERIIKRRPYFSTQRG